VRLLLAEDEYYTRVGLKTTFPWAECGIDELLVAQDGNEAMELLDRRPDILLTDIRMPYHTGIELASKARSRDEGCSILMLTSYSDKEYLKAAISLSIVAYLEKPVNLTELEAAVKLAVQRRTQALRLRALEQSGCGESPPYAPGSAQHHSTQSALRFIHDRYDDPALGLEAVAAHVHLNSDYLSTSFKEDVGVNLKRVITDVRLWHAKRLLLDTDESIQVVAERVGYSNSNYFAKSFRKETGMTPREFRDQSGKGGDGR